jgi:uncharacterized protein (DUF305 family)
MNNNQLKYGLIGAVIGGISVWLLMTTVFSSNNTGMMNYKTNTQGSMQTSNGIDAHFIEQMIPHHEDAITMAKLAQTKSQRPEVKELANNIIDSQGKEINQMKDWYKTWFSKEVPQDNQVMNQHGMMGTSNSTHMGMMGDASDMTNLEKSTDFDRAFVEEMIPHHQMAVMMASMLKNGTERPEMKKLTDDIIAAQTKEIDQMRQWLKNWQ